MSLVRLYRIVEAGVENEPTGKLRKKWRSFKHANGGAMSHSDDSEDGYEPVDRDEEEHDAPPERDEPERDDTPFASHSAKPSPAMQGGKTAGSLKADRETLSALERALENVRTGDDDLQEWIDDLLREIGRAIMKGGDVTLPKFVAASDDEGDEYGSEDEDY